VVLPAPLGPISVTIWPGSTLRAMLSSTFCPANVTPTCSRRI